MPITAKDGEKIGAQEAVSFEVAKAFHDRYYDEFKAWIRDPTTCWLNAEDAAWQAWSYLHDTKIADLTFPSRSGANSNRTDVSHG